MSSINKSIPTTNNNSNNNNNNIVKKSIKPVVKKPIVSQNKPAPTTNNEMRVGAHVTLKGRGERAIVSFLV